MIVFRCFSIQGSCLLEFFLQLVLAESTFVSEVFQLKTRNIGIFQIFTAHLKCSIFFLSVPLQFWKFCTIVYAIQQLTFWQVYLCGFTILLHKWLFGQGLDNKSRAASISVHVTASFLFSDCLDYDASIHTASLWTFMGC